MKKIVVTVSIALILCFSQQIYSQISTVSGFNYYDINKDAYTVDVSCLGGSSSNQDHKGYYFTTLHLAKVVDSIFRASTDSLNFVLGDYTIKKRSYFNRTLAGDKFRWILIRPNDTVSRPTVFATHGGKDGGSSPFRITLLGTYDYVQRGYAVVFHQSGRTNGTSTQFLADVGTDSSCYFGAPCSWSPDCDIECFQQAVLFKAQCTQAAAEYAAKNSPNLFLNRNQFFATGFSGGAIGTLYFALSDSSNLSSPLFNAMGNSLSSFSRYPNESFKLKAITTLAGGVIDSSSNLYRFNQLIDKKDTSLRVLMFHGQDDYAVQPDQAPLIWTEPALSLPGSLMNGTLHLRSSFNKLGIKNKAIINCSAGHDIYTYLCDYNDDVIGNNPQFLLPLNAPPCIDFIDNFYKSYYQGFDFSSVCSNDSSKWNKIFYASDQVHDYCKISSYYFHRDFSNSGPASPGDAFITNLLADTGIATVGPSDFPYDEVNNKTNGHFVQTSKCLAQTCSGLYFNEEGLIGGDFVTAPRITGNNPFNQDFTLEIWMKPINQIGPGTLFSHVKGTGFEGFEIFINSSGVIQFKKSEILGLVQLNIVGSTNVLDSSCHNIALTRSGNTFGLYVDGILQDIKKNSSYNFPTVPNYLIGNTLKNGTFDRGFNGIIRGVRIWNSELPTSNMGQINLPSTTANLTTDWEFNEGQSQNIVSTDLQDTIFLGKNGANPDNDPRWMKNDEMCDCGSNPTRLKYIEVDMFELSVYPNPNNGRFVLELKNESLTNSILSIYSVNGKLVNQIILSSNKQEIEIDNPGFYFLKLQNRNSQKTIKVVVQ